jgi:NADH:ubiquinone reductase (H+-translocating)
MPSQSHTAGPRPRVLVLGGGFAGLGAARALKDAKVDVQLVDLHDYHTFQPMLYQLATGLVDVTVVAHSLRDLFHDQPNAIVHGATVEAVDLVRREVQFGDMPPLGYDYLVFALGAQAAFFGVEGAEEHAFPLYSLPDAVRLRAQLVRTWERADRDPALVADGALNVVVVGGGPTGVESAGALSELFQGDFRKDYPALPVDDARLILVEAGPELFSMFKPTLRTYATSALEKRGVEVLTGEVVKRVTPTRVELASGTVLPAHTLVWGAGLHANPAAGTLGLELQKGGRILTEPDLSLAGHPRVFAVGDSAWTVDTKTSEVLPQLGSVALQAGEHAGENIARLVAGKPSRPFVYKDKGTMAAIARGAGAVQLPGGRTLKGKTAYLAWGAVHLTLLSAGEDRAKAIVDWTWAGVTHERAGRIDVDAGPTTVEAGR